CRSAESCESAFRRGHHGDCRQGQLMWRLTCIVATTTVLVACSGGGGGSTSPPPGPPPPSALSYSSPETAVVGQAHSVSPSVSGSVSNYTVSPALPTGLTINSSTGVIAGTPSGIAAAATYTVTASNVTGQTSFALALTVDPGPTVQLTVTATDPNGYALAYQWKTTDGALLS